jgi:hypothetical protein
MKKLKLETLEVTSFDTSAAPSEERGTVNGNAKPGGPVVIQTYSPQACGDTQYFDCTLGCSHLTYCAQCTIVRLTELECVDPA